MDNFRVRNLDVSEFINNETEKVYYDNIPEKLKIMFIERCDNLKIDHNRICPEFVFKTGNRTQSLTFTKPQNNNHVGRFIINFGPNDNFCYRKLTGKKGEKYMVETSDFGLDTFEGKYIKMEYDNCDLHLYADPRRYVILNHYTIKNGKIIDHEETTKYSIRSTFHKSIVCVITLWIKQEEKIDDKIIKPEFNLQYSLPTVQLDTVLDTTDKPITRFED